MIVTDPMHGILYVRSSEQFVSGVKSNSPLAQNCMPSLFRHVKSSEKCQLEAQMAKYEPIRLRCQQEKTPTGIDETE